MKKSASMLAALLASACISAHAQSPETLLKRIDVKSYEGYLQVTPAASKSVELDINFIRPAYDTQPTTAGAMVGLIQTTNTLHNLEFKIDQNCKGEIISKVGIQEFGGGNVGYLKTTWSADAATDKISLVSREFQARGGSVEDVNPSQISGRMSKGQWITIKLPESLEHAPGDILVMEQLRYTSITSDFSSCRVMVRKKS